MKYLSLIVGLLFKLGGKNSQKKRMSNKNFLERKLNKFLQIIFYKYAFIKYL